MHFDKKFMQHKSTENALMFSDVDRGTNSVQCIHIMQQDNCSIVLRPVSETQKYSRSPDMGMIAFI